MLKIGDFSKLSYVSAKALRHYDDLGLLQPAHIDPATGYRYYTVDQLPRLHRILALKDLGLALEPPRTRSAAGMLTALSMPSCRRSGGPGRPEGPPDRRAAGGGMKIRHDSLPVSCYGV